MQTLQLGLPHGVSRAVLWGVAAWLLAVLAVVLILLLLVAFGSRADRRRRDIDVALAECLGTLGPSPGDTSARSGHLVRDHGRVVMWRSSQLVPYEPQVREEVVNHMLQDARRELSVRGLAPLGEPRLESHPVVWVESSPDAPTGTYVTAAAARAAGRHRAPTLSMLSVSWPIST